MNRETKRFEMFRTRYTPALSPTVLHALPCHSTIQIFTGSRPTAGDIYSLCPGTAQKRRVRAATHAATSRVTQIARPMSNLRTYGSRIVRVRKGVDSD